jgi:hypothetical protein
MGHRNNSDGSTDNRSFYLYGYSFTLNSAKTVQSVRLPADANVIVTAISLVPNWSPSFNVNPLTLANATAGSAYSGTIATNASDLNGDPLTYALVSGPAWLIVGTDGTLSGTPLASDAGTNNFEVSVTDPGGLSATATLNISVNPVTPFVASFTTQSTGSLGLSWAGGNGPFQVQWTTNLVNPVWQNLGSTISSNSVVIVPTNGAMFYRIIGQ